MAAKAVVDERREAHETVDEDKKNEGVIRASRKIFLKFSYLMVLNFVFSSTMNIPELLFANSLNWKFLIS